MHRSALMHPVVSNRRPEEPDSFRTAYNGAYAVLIGPAFSNDATLNAELLTHRVSLFTVDDLCAMLQAQVGPAELLPALAQTILQTGRKLQTAFTATPIKPQSRRSLTTRSRSLSIKRSFPQVYRLP